MENIKRKVRILVLGDIGCSPRMKNHCLSFAISGWEVFFTGYLNSDLPISITSNDMIHLETIRNPPDCFEKRKKFKIFLIFKILLTTLYLLWHLICCEWTPVLLIQNPPAVPTFVVAWIISTIRGTRLIVDWHNYGHTLMTVESGNESILTKLYKHVELKFSRRLNAYNFCVSKAFKNDLLLKWNIASTVLYDLPWNINADRDVHVSHDLFVKLSKGYPQFGSDSGASATAFTEVSIDGQCQYRPKRPVLLISSCSWTIDDDIETLFKALDLYNEQIVSGDVLPDIICVITGRGPKKSYFERLMLEQKWTHVKVVMPWLEADDYPRLLAAADLGICLHKSTSGLDLPMKVVDMFSVGLPVLALNYKCLHELVHDRVNGRLFSTTEGLSGHLCDLLASFPESGGTDLALYRDNVVHKSRNGYWQQHWEHTLLPVAEDILKGPQDKAQ